MKKLGILNGPNLNRLGKRDPELYGSQTLEDLEQAIKSEAQGQEMELTFFQSNHEGEIVDTIAQWTDQSFDAVIINAAAFTHTSVAILDAIECSKVPFIEVHLSHIYAREEFRRKSLIAPACIASITGLGVESYLAAVRYLAKTFKTEETLV